MNLNRKFLAAKYKNLKYLTEITLRSNQIKSIDNETFNDLDNLICVNISSNQIEKINNGVFNCLVKLTIISLSSNKINEIDHNAFKGCLNLNVIYLSNNNIKHLEKDTFTGLNQLNTIWLNNNEFKSDKLELELEKSVKFISFKNDFLNNIDSIIQKQVNNFIYIYNYKHKSYLNEYRLIQEITENKSIIELTVNSKVELNNQIDSEWPKVMK